MPYFRVELQSKLKDSPNWFFWKQKNFSMLLSSFASGPFFCNASVLFRYQSKKRVWLHWFICSPMPISFLSLILIAPNWRRTAQKNIIGISVKFFCRHVCKFWSNFSPPCLQVLVKFFVAMTAVNFARHFADVIFLSSAEKGNALVAQKSQFFRR